MGHCCSFYIMDYSTAICKHTQAVSGSLPGLVSAWMDLGYVFLTFKMISLCISAYLLLTVLCIGARVQLEFIHVLKVSLLTGWCPAELH